MLRPKLLTKGKYFTLLWKITLIVFIVEGAIMVGFQWLRIDLGPMAEVIVDVGVLAVLSTPLILVVAVRPYVDRWHQASIELQQSQNALRESEQRFRDFAQASADWLWETDENLRFTYLSEGIREVIGEEADTDNLLGKTRLEVAADADENSEKWRKHMENMEARKPIRDFTYTYVTPNGATVYFLVDGNPIHDR